MFFKNIYIFRVDPGNKAIQPYLIRLHKAVSEKLNEMAQVGNKVKSMFDIVFDPNVETEKREKGADNFVVLAREKSGADVLYKEGAIPKIAQLMKVEKNPKIRFEKLQF